MSKRLRLLLTALIIAGQMVMPFRAGWAASLTQPADETPRCQMTANNTPAMQGDIGITPDTASPLPCCRDHCDGCDGDCSACSPVNVTLLFLPAAPHPPASIVIQLTAAFLAGDIPEPLLRPPPATHS